MNESMNELMNECKRIKKKEIAKKNKKIRTIARADQGAKIYPTVDRAAEWRSG